MLSTMQDYPLTISSILEFGSKIHAGSEVATWTGDGAVRSSFRDIALRVRRLAAALHRLGIRPGDRVGTLCWNTQQHLEAYFAIPSMGAVAHTLNLRLFPDQLAYVIRHAEDRILIVDSSLMPLLEKIADKIPSVERVIVVGEGHERSPEKLSAETLSYEELLAAEQPEFEW